MPLWIVFNPQRSIKIVPRLLTIFVEKTDFFAAVFITSIAYCLLPFACCLRRYLFWETNRESRTFSHFAIHRNFRTHSFSQTLANCQSQSRASIPASSRVVCLGKRFKYTFELFFRHADARIANAEN
jgi:hypothetical protein